MSDLVVIVPSRGRPHTVAELAKAFAETCTDRTRLVFALDESDPVKQAYFDAMCDQQRCTHITGENGSMVEALNHAAVLTASGRLPAHAIAFMGDDHRPRTKGWDAAYLDALREMGTGIVYGNDLYQGARIPTQCAMTADIITTLGYMAPPGFVHLGVDNAWLEIGRAIGRIRYLPDVVVEHLHPVAGKAAWDEGYVRVNAPEMYRRDLAELERWRREDLPAEAARLRRIAR